MADTPHADVKQLSFERAIEELESIVKRLEDGKVPLEESVAIYERGESLKRRCEELLRQAEVEADRLGVANVQIAVGLGRKARVHPAAMLVGLDVGADDVADEIPLFFGRGHAAEGITAIRK